MPPPDTQWMEHALRQLAAGTAVPECPDLAAALRSRLDDPEPHRPVRRRHWAVASVALVVVTVAAALVVSAGSRDAIAGFFGGAVRGHQIDLQQATPAATADQSASATPFPSIDAVAVRSTLETAEAATGVTARIPEGVTIDDIFVVELIGTRILVLRTPGYDLWEYRNDQGATLNKAAFTGSTSASEIIVNGQPGYWITGSPRLITVRDPNGADIGGIALLATRNALVWAEGEVTYRVEGASSVEEALQIARSLAPREPVGP